MFHLFKRKISLAVDRKYTWTIAENEEETDNQCNDKNEKVENFVSPQMVIKWLTKKFHDMNLS